LSLLNANGSSCFFSSQSLDHTCNYGVEKLKAKYKWTRMDPMHKIINAKVNSWHEISVQHYFFMYSKVSYIENTEVPHNWVSRHETGSTRSLQEDHEQHAVWFFFPSKKTSISHIWKCRDDYILKYFLFINIYIYII
jgi:hypothetical protein